MATASFRQSGAKGIERDPEQEVSILERDPEQEVSILGPQVF